MKRRITSEIKILHNTPTLFVNGNPADRLAYMTYLAEEGHYGDFTQAGYRLFSVSLFFGTNNLNEFSGSRSFSRGLYDTEEPYYEEFDRNIRRILDACPNALILPRVNVNLPEA